MAAYKVHPAIGVARLGDSTDFYVAPETSGGLPSDESGDEVSSFRDADGQLLRQAARFKIFIYDDESPAGRELAIGDTVPTASGTATVAAIRWTVHLANKKASWYQFHQLDGEEGYSKSHQLRNQTVTEPADRKKLIIDPGPLTLSGPGERAEFARGQAQGGYHQTFPPNLKPFPIDTLGEIRTDGHGRLLVLGGPGHSGSSLDEVRIDSYSNNPGWFDDIADGPVSAELVLSNDATAEVVAAWVLVAPPAFAPQILNMITLYDAIYDLFVRELGYNPNLCSGGNFNDQYTPDYESEIGSLVGRPGSYRWVVDMPSTGVGQHGQLTKYDGFGSLFQKAFDQLREPGDPNEGPKLMPGLAGDDPIHRTSWFMTLTRTQYHLLRQWTREVKSKIGSSLPKLGPGEALDFATLDNCVGGAFCPGIEITWICRNKTVYQPLPEGYRPSDAFRVRHKDVSGGLTLTNGADGDYSGGVEPGDLSKYMALPWQADFHECSSQGEVNKRPLWWWPAQRPYEVRLESDPDGPPQAWDRGIPENSDDPPYLGDLAMVSDWKDLGFVVMREGKGFVEVERRKLETGPKQLAPAGKVAGLEP